MLSDFCPDICPWADIVVALPYLRMGKIGIIHRFSRLVSLLFHKWLHVRLNHKDACILTLT